MPNPFQTTIHTGPLVDTVAVQPLDSEQMGPAIRTNLLRVLGFGQDPLLKDGRLAFLITQTAALELMEELRHTLQVIDSRLSGDTHGKDKAR